MEEKFHFGYCNVPVSQSEHTLSENEYLGQKKKNPPNPNTLVQAIVGQNFARLMNPVSL